MMNRTRILSLVVLTVAALCCGPSAADSPRFPAATAPSATAPWAAAADQAPLATTPTNSTADDSNAVSDSSADAGSAVTPSTMPASEVPQPERSSGKSLTKEDVSVSNAGNVEIHVSDANLVDVLRMLSLQSQTNILPSKEVKGTVTANLYDVTVREALDAILRANGCNYRERGNVVYVYSNAEWVQMQKAERVMQTEIFRLYYATAANVAVLIKPVLSTDGQVALTPPGATGIGSSTSDVGANSHAIEEMLVVTDTPEVLEKIRKIIKEVDRRPQQILVEATILEATLSENTSLGIDFTLLGGVDFNALSAAAGSSSSSSSASGTTTLTPSQAAIQGGTAVVFPNLTTNNGVGIGNTNFSAGLPARFGFISSNVSAFVQALEETTDTVVLANPKVLVLDKQKGEVKVASEIPFRGQTTTNSSGLSQQDVEFEETGTILIFRPYIAQDGYVRLEIHPEDSAAGAPSADGLPPTKTTTESTTDIMVKDGRTIVISGMFRENTVVSRSQVPWLGNLPVVGPLFRSQADSTTRQEVIILLTPHIIKDDAEYSNASADELKDLERLRVGVRHGLMPFGRERLAEAEYQKAQHELDQPNPDFQKALWHLNCATNLNPMFLEAITLKEKISGQTLTCVDNSIIRTLVKQQIMADRMALPQQPRSVQIGAIPATQPTGFFQAAATQPVAATQATAATTQSVAAATQPVADVRAAAAATQAAATTAPAITVTPTPPATQPAAPVVAAPATQPALTEAPATAPASQPSAAGATTSKKGVIITELPSDDPTPDLKDDAQKSDK